MYSPNTIPYCNRAIRRRVEKFRKKYPYMTFTQAYNLIYRTSYEEPVDLNSTKTDVPLEILNTDANYTIQDVEEINDGISRN